MVRSIVWCELSVFFFGGGSESEVARWANTASRMPESEMTLTLWSVDLWQNRSLNDE